MNMFKVILGGIIISFLTVGCAVKVPFTNAVVEKYDLTEMALRQVQFYTSEYIVLESKNSTGNQYVSDGKIVDSQNNKNYRVIIQPQTKCILEKRGDNGEIYIRFEQGKDKFLKFVVRKNDPAGKYYLEADYSDKSQGKVTYENKTYYINSSSGNAYLMVSVRKLNKTYGKNKYVKGMKVK
jgi:hypothetical protein